MLILRREHHPSAIWQVLHKTWATLIMLNTSSWILKKSFLWGLIRGALEMILKNSSPYAQVSNILFRKERQNWKPIYSGCPDAPLFNQEKSKLMQTKGQLSKNQSCFFVCTTFDSFLNDLQAIKIPPNLKQVWRVLVKSFGHSNTAHQIAVFFNLVDVPTSGYVKRKADKLWLLTRSSALHLMCLALWWLLLVNSLL